MQKVMERRRFVTVLREIRQSVLDTALKLKQYGLVVVAGGTVCVKDPETNLIAITPSGMDYDEMTWEDVCIIDDELNVVDSRRKISVASDMFVEIFKARKDLTAVIHTHSRYATSFSCIDKEIPVLTTTQANICGGPVPIVKPLHPGPHDAPYLKRIVDTLGEGYAVNLMNHGPVCVGETLEKCLEVAITIEVTAHNAFIANTLGSPYILSLDEAKIAFDHCNKSVGQK